MISASVRKSVTDLSRRRARTAFTVLTLALAVTSISFLAIPTLIDRAMQDEVRAGRLADVSLPLRPVELTDDDLAALEAIPNVAAVEARNSVDVRVMVGERRAPARVLGVRDFDDQAVDVVRVDSGAFPASGELLADVQDANVDVYDGRAGDTITVLEPSGDDAELFVSGRGRSLPGGEQVQDEDLVVFYASAETVAALSGEPGYGGLAVRLDDPSAGAADETVDAIHRALNEVPGFAGFSDLPEVRAPGDWPGKSDTEDFGKFVSVITVLALLSALVLISNTMSTLVAEQTREIAVMRALGARRRQVARVYIRTALFLGIAGAIGGVVLGTVLASVLADYFGSMFWVVDVGFGVVVPIVFVALAVGLVAPPLAALPAVRRGARLDLREALEASGSALGGEDAADRLVRRATFLPRVMQVGLRNLGRRKRRSFATAFIVALAVGNLLAVLALAESATQTTRAAWSDHLEDVQVWSGGGLFDAHAARTIRETPGVAEAQPVLKNKVALEGNEAFVWAVVDEPLFRYRIGDGRWFGTGDSDASARVAVIERNLADIAGVDVGDNVTLETAAGDADFAIIGIADNQQENGTALFVPLSTARTLLGQPDGATSYWVRMDSRDESQIDRTTTLLEDRLAALGYEVGSEIRHVAERDEVAANRTITTTIALLGFVIVAMSMVGLANAMTTNVLERVREIGVLRCIGARARDVRRIFMTEGVALAFTGWLLGIPLGYLLHRALVRLVWEVVGVRLPVVYPPWNLLVALAGTVVLAVLVLFLPVRRAVRLRPGDALHYA